MIDSDLPMKEFEEIAKRAYVLVAASRATRTNGTVNHSRVAAITGLSRADVKTILAQQAPPSEAAAKSRAARVIAGWTTDPRFLRRSGAPRILDLSNGPNGFKELVRLYAGDIPPKALLDRLERLRLVRVSGPRAKAIRRVHLLKKAPVQRLNPATAALLEHLASALQPTLVTQLPAVASIRLSAKDAPRLAAITRAAIERRDTFLSGLASSFTGSPAKDSSIEIFVSMAKPGKPSPRDSTSNTKRKSRRQPKKYGVE
jgi:hypothetical protein